MRRWEVLGLILAVGLLVWLGQLWLDKKPIAPSPPPAVSNHCQAIRPAYQTTTMAINYRAPLAANGSPLPTEIDEDVVLEITSAGGDLVFWSLDHPNNDWVLDYPSDGLRRKLCFVTGHYFFYNLDQAVWDEVDSSLLDESILELTRPERYLLAVDQLADFKAVATAGPDESCPPNNCAVWLADSLDSDNQIRIRVNKQTRKTNDVFISGSQDQTVVHFYYQPVELEVPTPVRWLPDNPV